MKTNFRKSESDSTAEHIDTKTNVNKTNLTREEFEEYVSKTGAKGSFMVYRSTKKDEELGLDEL